jgi:MFS family permease
VEGGLINLLRRYALPSFLNFGYVYTLWIILAYVPLYLTDLGFSHLQISVLISIFPLSSLALLFPFGIFCDRLPPKRLVTAGFILFASFLTGLRWVEGFPPLLALFVIGGIGGSLFRISCSSLYYKLLGEKDTGKKLGFYMGIGLFGYGLGPLTGGFLLADIGMTSLLWIAFLVLMPFLFLSLFLEDVKLAKFELGDYRRDIVRKEVVVLVVLTFLLSLHLGVEQTSFSLFLKEDIGLLEDSIGWMFCFIGMAVAIGSIATGYMSDSITGRGLRLGAVLYLGLLISGLFNISLLFVGAFGTVLMMRLLHVLGDSLFLVSRMVIVSNLFLPERIGGNLGVLDTTIFVGTFVGAIVSGAIPGYLYPFVFAGSLAILAIPVTMSVRPKF